MNAEHGLSLVDSVLSAGPIGLATFGLLIISSILSWGIIFLKWSQLRKVRRQNSHFEKLFWNAGSMDEVETGAQSLSDSPLAQIFQAGLLELKRLRKKAAGGQQMHDSIENVERALRKSFTVETQILEKRTHILATVGSTAPFIGLFGTVVGIINAFSNIAAQKSASLVTVAPGIAEALVATAAGLVAAIPSVIAYNFFNTTIHHITNDMSTFSNDYLNLIKRKYA